MSDSVPLSRPIIAGGLEVALLALDAAAEAGASALLVSPPGAAAYAGAGWFKAMSNRLRTLRPEADFVAVLDCANWPGRVLEALRAGVDHVRFTGDGRSTATLTALAAAHGATVWTDIGGALDLRLTGKPEAACRAWMAEEALSALVVRFADRPAAPDLRVAAEGAVR